MIIILIAIIVILLFVIVYLNVEFYREKKDFGIKLEKLQHIIVEISKKQSGQNDRIRLSEELDQTIKNNNAILSNDIFSLNHDLFEILSKNNLLKK